MTKHRVSMIVNGMPEDGLVEPRTTLADFLRDGLGLTGTKLGCEQGVCGACTVLIEGQAVRSCLMFAMQIDGTNVTTVEGLAQSGQLSRLQQAFWENHALQCGFCTPGFLISAHALLREVPDPDEEQIRDALSGNLCRCTGYQTIIEAVKSLAEGGRV